MTVEEKWIRKETAQVCGVLATEDTITMGWLFHLCDRMPETRRRVVVEAALWGVCDEEMVPFDRCPFNLLPLAPRVAAQLKIPEASLGPAYTSPSNTDGPQSSATLLSFALCEEGTIYERQTGSLIMCATEEQTQRFLQRLPNSTGCGTVENASLAPYRYLSDVSQADRFNSLTMLREATATANTIIADNTSATTQVSPSLMTAPFTEPLGKRLLGKAGGKYCATNEPATVKDQWG